MTKEKLVKEVEEMIDALREEAGENSTKEEIIPCVLINFVYGYYKDMYTIEDVYEVSKYIDTPVDIEKIVIEKVARKKRKEQKTKAKNGGK